MLRHLVLFATLSLPLLARAQAPQAAQAGAPQVQAPRAPASQRLSMTIYNSDLALVEDVRAMPVAAGRQRLEFKDVSGAIRPETVALSTPGVQIVEQNFDYDLLTPDKLMEEAVGRRIVIVRLNPATGAEIRETATVLGVNEGVVLKIGDRIEVLRDDGVPTRVIFDEVPPNLRARPTLSVTVDSDRAGPRDVRLSYLTTGLSWKADYVALFDEAKNALDLQGWITLSNTSGVSYANVDTQLVAGDLNLVRSEQEWRERDYRRRQTRQGQTAGGKEVGGARPLADYYLYPLAEPTTIAQNQTKQVGFLNVQGASARKIYQHRADWFQTSEEPISADVVLEFANTRAGGLGAQLPAGIVRVYLRDQAGEPKFIGENRIDHTAQGSELAVKTGEAFDVTVQPTLVRHEAVSLFRSRYAMSYAVRNARAEPVSVEIRQAGLIRDGRVLQENMPSRRADARTLEWDVRVPAGGETVLTFTVETGW